MLKKIKLFIFFILCLFGLNAATPLHAELTQKTTAEIGLFVNSIYDLNFPQNSFAVDFWLWANYRNPDYKALQTLDIPTAKEISVSLASSVNRGGIYWNQQKIRAIIKKKWQVWNYPFDSQTLDIPIEEALYDVNMVNLQGDVKNSKIDEDLTLPGWKIENFFLHTEQHTYSTTYGDPQLQGNSIYPRVIFSITLKRKSVGIFFKLFSGIYIAFFIAIIAFFINPLNCDPRFGLPVGGLFAAIGNKYIVDASMPDSNGISLVDMVHSLTFFYIFLVIVLSAISLYLTEINKAEKSEKMDKICAIVIISSYILFNVVLVFFAVND